MINLQNNDSENDRENSPQPNRNFSRRIQMHHRGTVTSAFDFLTVRSNVRLKRDIITRAKRAVAAGT